MANNTPGSNRQDNLRFGVGQNNFVRFQDIGRICLSALFDVPTIGNPGEILQVNADGTALEYVTNGSAPVTAFGTLSADGPAVDTVRFYLVDTSSNDVTVTLPNQGSVTEWTFIKTSSANNLILTPASGTINGEASVTFTGEYDAVQVVTDTTNYYII